MTPGHYSAGVIILLYIGTQAVMKTVLQIAECLQYTKNIAGKSQQAMKRM